MIRTLSQQVSDLTGWQGLLPDVCATFDDILNNDLQQHLLRFLGLATTFW